ncbi:MAG: hypothetical protein AMXMBFR13_42870 [Phycisphaerae bacterium]
MSLAAANLPTSIDPAAVRAIPVQHDGRWMPLDTLARDTVESVTGTDSFQGRSAVLWLLAWSFDAHCWMREPLIPIPNAELRAELNLDTSRNTFSYAELIGHHKLHEVIESSSRLEKGQKPDPLQSKAGDINEKLHTLQQVFGGQAIRLIPHATDPLAAWRAIEPSAAGHQHAAAGDPPQAPPSQGGEESLSTQHSALSTDQAWAALKTSFLADDAAGFSAAAESLRGVLAQLPAAYRPDAKTLAVELRYNRLRPFRTAWMLMVGGAVLAAGAMIVRRRWFDLLTIAGLIAGFGMLTYGLSMRWQIAGRIPAANMFESLLFLSWGMGAFAIVSMVLLRHRLVPLTSSAMGAVALILADCLPIDHYVRPIAPVLLDTVWMSIHVPVIMVSYSVLALAVLIAHLQLAALAVAPQKRQFTATLDTLHYWYVHTGAFLLIVGIITGSMWAAFSWGRYWGWDPKEVWSLVAFLGYVTILHVRIDHERVPRWAYGAAIGLALLMFALVIPKLAPITPVKVLTLTATGAAMGLFVLARSPFTTAVKSILAFWLIVMTYVGVNYVLGTGLHSYGFGTGAVVRYLFLTAGIDLALVALCCGVYLARTAGRPQRVLAVGLAVENQ